MGAQENAVPSHFHFKERKRFTKRGKETREVQRRRAVFPGFCDLKKKKRKGKFVRRTKSEEIKILRKRRSYREKKKQKKEKNKRDEKKRREHVAKQLAKKAGRFTPQPSKKKKKRLLSRDRLASSSSFGPMCWSTPKHAFQQRELLLRQLHNYQLAMQRPPSPSLIATKGVELSGFVGRMWRIQLSSMVE